MLKVSLLRKGRSNDDVNYHQTLTLEHSQACKLDFSIVIKNTDKENGSLLYH